MSNRWVLHFDMDAFFASVEQLTRPTLRGRPVLVGGLGGRGVVAGASYEARLFGARSAMPMHQARRLVGAAGVVLPPRGAVYSVASRRVFDAVRELNPVLEVLSFDEAFAEPAELAGASKEAAEQYAHELRARIFAATALTASVGVGPGKQTAKIASGLAKPDGVLVVSSDEQEAVLSHLSVRKLWGIGPVAGEKLGKLGIATIGQFAALSPLEVTSVLGATLGPALHQLARGVDDRPVATRSDAKQISAEHTFEVDITSLDRLRVEIERSCDGALRRLLADGRGARTVVLKLKRTDMSILTRSATLPFATTERAPLLATAHRLALDPLEVGAIRLVGVGFSGLTAVQQFSLFEDEVGDVIGVGPGDHPGGDHPGGDLPGGDPPGGDMQSESEGEDSTHESEVAPSWHTGLDVRHAEFGHGWIQGAGHGVVSVRFETRTSGPGRMRTFAATDRQLEIADPVDSLDW